MEKRLKGKEKKLYRKLMDLYAKESSYYVMERFVFGFRMGARFTAESLFDAGDFVQERGTINVYDKKEHAVIWGCSFIISGNVEKGGFSYD